MRDGTPHAPGHTACVVRNALSPTLGPTFRALSDPQRRYYLECLLDGEMRLLEFCEQFPIRESTVFH